MNVTTNLKRLFASSQTCEKRLPSFIESLEKQKSNLEKRRDAYDAKEYLTDRRAAGDAYGGDRGMGKG